MSTDHVVSLGGFDAWLEYCDDEQIKQEEDTETEACPGTEFARPVSLHCAPTKSNPTGGTKGMVATVHPSVNTVRAFSIELDHPHIHIHNMFLEHETSFRVDRGRVH